MDQTNQDPNLEDSIRQVMQTLPPPIRDYLSQEKYTPVTKELMAKYGLRIDQGGVLERGILMLLMGVDDPNEFMQSLLAEAKLDQRTVSGIMQDVNTQIFIPLRDEMRKEPVAPEAAKPPVPATPATAPAAATPPLVLTAGAKLPQIIVPTAPVKKPALRDVLASVMKAPQSVQADPSVAPAPATPTAPQKAAPPDNLPGAPREIHAPPAVPTPESKTQPPEPLALTTLAKPYSVDPYREPLDEKQ